MLSTYLLRLEGLDVWTASRGPADDPRAQLVAASGARYVSTADQPLAALRDEVGGFDLVVEATGNAQVMADSIGLLGRNGVACLLGLRWLRTEHLEELRSVPLFSGLSDHELLWVLRTARGESFAPGTTIIREGDIGGDFYMLTEGTVKVSVDGTEVATLGGGSYFGEIALIDGGSRTATITATSPGAVAPMPSIPR